MESQKELGTHIKAVMYENDVSQIDICRISPDISTTVLNYVCQGRRAMRVPVAVALEKAGLGSATIWMQLQSSLLINQHKSKSYYRNGSTQ